MEEKDTKKDKIVYTEKDFVKSKSYSLNKTLFAKAVGVLIKVLLRCLTTKSTDWTARIITIIEVKDNKVKNRYATITVSTNPLLEDNTVILDPEEMSIEDSSVFKAMKLKAGVF